MTVLFLFLFVNAIDIRNTWSELIKVNYVLLIPAIAVYLISVYFRSIRWRYILTPIEVLPILNLYKVVSVGYMANNLLPLRLGEIVRAHYLGQKEGVSRVSAFATIAVERIFDGVALLFIGGMTAIFLPVMSIVEGLGSVAGLPWWAPAAGLSLPFIAASVFMISSSYYYNSLKVLVDKIADMFPSNIGEKLRTSSDLFLRGFVVVHGPKRLMSVFLLSMPVWLMEALMYYFIAMSFGFEQQFGFIRLIGIVILVLVVSNLITAIPSAGGGVGTFEVGSLTTLTVLGVDPSLSGAYTIVLHIALLLPITLLGMVFLLIEDKSVLGLVRESRMAEIDS